MPTFNRYPKFNQDSGGEGGGGGGGGTQTGGQPIQKTEPEVFSREYVKELRHESASYRTKAQEAERKAQEADERAKKAAEDAQASTKAAEEKANERIIRAELKAAAIKAGMVDLDGLKLADLSSVKLNDAGDVEGAEALMEKMKEAKPYLFQATSSTSSTEKKPEKKPDQQPSAQDMTPEQWKEHKRKNGLM